MALADDAHLIGAAMTGVSRTVYRHGIVDTRDPNLSRHLDILRDKARQELQEFDTIVRAAGVRSFKQCVVDDDAAGGLALQARHCDIVIIGQCDPDEPLRGRHADLPQHVVMHAGRPVLVIPYAGSVAHVGSKVLIGWDAGREAARAVADAMPVLARAKSIHLAVFNPYAIPGEHGVAPGAGIGQYFERHGIRVEILAPSAKGNTGTALLSLARDLGIDLIVMGAYGHTRLREVVLGGVTRTMLHAMTVPVLMSH
jgi:nucleotide-binding universal stress UspA family protein